MTQPTPPQRNFPSDRETTQTRLTQQWDGTSPTLDALKLPAGTETVLIPVEGNPSTDICHLPSDDTQPLCGCRGTFTQHTSEFARTRVDRLCENCRTRHTGTQRTRPCPYCETPVSVSAWPQHVRECTND